MASGIYDAFKNDLFLKQVALTVDSFKVALYDNTHVFTSTDTVYTATNEVAGTGYTAGGVALASLAVTGTATQAWDAADSAWTTATFSAYHAVIYDVTNSNSLVCNIDFGGIQTVTAGTFTIQWHADGIITLS
jgi:hypothetical protein